MMSRRINLTLRQTRRDARKLLLLSGVMMALLAASHAQAQPLTPADIALHERDDGWAFATKTGMTLYVLQAQAFCAGECAPMWKPLTASSEATPIGDWSLLTRADGSKQWAYRGAVVHTFAGDARPGDANGEGFLASNGYGRRGFWHAAYQPWAFPPEAATFSIPVVGKVLADRSGRTLYTFDKDVGARRSACEKLCARDWNPLTASALANAKEPWSLVQRSDGSKQWAFKGRPLYTYAKDARPGDLNGNGVDRFWHALILRAPPKLPAGITIQDTVVGPVYADDKGLTFYAYFETPERLKVICPEICMRTNWRPAVPPRGAVPVGAWTITSSMSGERQWAYQGRPLYFFNRDELPGDLRGSIYGSPADQSGSWDAIQVQPPS